jgi:hypothetical protein
MKEFNLQPGAEVGRLKNILEEKLLDGEITSQTSVEEMIEILKGETK